MLGEEWREWLRATFTEKQGRNLRNIFTHGELAPARHEDAVLVLTAAVYLSTLAGDRLARDQRDGAGPGLRGSGRIGPGGR